MRLLTALRQKGFEFKRSEELAMLAFLACIGMTAEDIATAVYDTDEFLKLHSGFNDGEGLVLRHVYACMLVTMAYAKSRGIEGLGQKLKENPEFLKRMVLMQSQSVMHIQMEYVDKEDLHI